jgi:maltose alpha-D-glucosyltransferase/alpha-amylase
MTSLVRGSYQNLHKQLDHLPSWVQDEADPLVGKRNEILDRLKKIYSKKLDIVKIRVHGNYDLNKVLLTGKDLVIQDFGGDPYRSYGERRIRRSALWDIASMIASIYYVSYEGFFTNNQVSKEDVHALLPYADQWAFYMSSFFLKKYFENIGDGPLVPKDKEDLQMVLETFLVERGLNHLNYELNKRPDWVVVPLRLLKSILGHSSASSE